MLREILFQIYTIAVSKHDNSVIHAPVMVYHGKEVNPVRNCITHEEAQSIIDEHSKTGFTKQEAVELIMRLPLQDVVSKFDPTPFLNKTHYHLTSVSYTRDMWLENPVTHILYRDHRFIWKCDCGKEIEAPYYPVAYGNIRHCGSREHYAQTNTAHHIGRGRGRTTRNSYDDPRDHPGWDPMTNRLPPDGLAYLVLCMTPGSRLYHNRKARKYRVRHVKIIYRYHGGKRPRIAGRPIKLEVPALDGTGRGVRIGRLTVLGIHSTVRRHVGKNGYPTVEHPGAKTITIRYYDVQCDCGTKLVASLRELVSRQRQSCGCADDWSDYAIAYAQTHPGVYQDEDGCFRDIDGFQVLIPKLRFRTREKTMLDDTTP